MKGPYTQTRLPSPGDDATPFLLRCYVRPAPFRPVQEFDQPMRPKHDEYKLYVWRSATLRDIAVLLHHRDPRISSPTTLHAFRVVYFDSKRDAWVSREAGLGVTRVGPNTVLNLLEDGDDEAVVEDEGSLTRDAVDQKRANERKSFRDMFPAEADERASKRTLEELGLIDGDLIDCVVKEPPPNLSISGSSSRVRNNSGRAVDRPPSIMVPLGRHPWDISSGRLSAERRGHEGQDGAFRWGKGTHERSFHYREREHPDDRERSIDKEPHRKRSRDVLSASPRRSKSPSR